MGVGAREALDEPPHDSPEEIAQRWDSSTAHVYQHAKIPKQYDSYDEFRRAVLSEFGRTDVSWSKIVHDLLYGNDPYEEEKIYVIDATLDTGKDVYKVGKTVDTENRMRNLRHDYNMTGNEVVFERTLEAEEEPSQCETRCLNALRLLGLEAEADGNYGTEIFKPDKLTELVVKRCLRAHIEDLD